MLVIADQLVLLGLVEKEAVDRIPLLLALRELLEQARELCVLLRRDREPVAQRFRDRQPGHHQSGAIRTLLKAPDGLLEQNAVNISIPESRAERGKLIARPALHKAHTIILERHSVHDHPRHVRVGHVLEWSVPTHCNSMTSATRASMSPSRPR